MAPADCQFLTYVIIIGSVHCDHVLHSVLVITSLQMCSHNNIPKIDFSTSLCMVTNLCSSFLCDSSCFTWI